MLAPGGLLAGKLVLLSVVFALVGLHRIDRLGALGRRAYAVGLAALLAISAIAASGAVARHFPTQRDWDFKVFWLSGRAAAQGGSPYAPQDLEAAAAGTTLGIDFRDELVARGSPYPPPTIALLLPLGRLEIGAAAKAWFALLTALLGASIWLLWREFFRVHGAFGLAACAAIVLAFRPTSETLWVAQTHFALLAVLVLMWRARDRLAGGIWLALGMTIKPIFVLLLPFTASRADWRGLLGLGLAMAGLWGLALAALGSDFVASYFLDPPLAKRSPQVMAQPINQSILGVLLRALKPDLAGRSALFLPGFLASAGALFAATSALLLRKGRASGEAEIALVLAFALLVYPASLHHYATLLLFPLCLLWRERERLLGGPAVAIATIGALAWLSCRGGNAVFATTIVVWCAMAVLSLRSSAAARAAVPAA